MTREIPHFYINLNRRLKIQSPFLKIAFFSLFVKVRNRENNETLA